jgi:hypothetical protein
MNNFKTRYSVKNYIEEIGNELKTLCIENNINYNKQNYKILIVEETLKDSELIFTSGSSKTLSFYGRVYLDSDAQIVEKIHNQGGVDEHHMVRNSFIIISGGTKSSTRLSEDVQVLSFYIAPKSLIDGQFADNWKSV